MRRVIMCAGAMVISAMVTTGLLYLVLGVTMWDAMHQVWRDGWCGAQREALAEFPKEMEAIDADVRHEPRLEGGAPVARAAVAERWRTQALEYGESRFMDARESYRRSKDLEKKGDEAIGDVEELWELTKPLLVPSRRLF